MIQPPSGLFTAAGDPAPEYWVDDLANLHRFIHGFYGIHGIDSGVDFLDLLGVEMASERILLASVGITTPSVFKRVAAFTIGFMLQSPVKQILGPDGFKQELAKVGRIENHQNAVIAFEYARACLVTAKYTCGDSEVVLENPIAVSCHFYADLIFSFSTLPKKPISEPAVFHELALLYEALAYKANPTCCDALEA